MRLNFLFNQRLRNSNSKTNWGIKKEKMDRKLEKAPLMREIEVGFVDRNDDETRQLSRRVQQATEEGRERILGEKRLYEASLSGSVESLKQLMKEDPLTLARASITCFNETPLHIAAMLGHLDYSQVILHHKSDLTSEVDLQGRSPLHLASANGYVEIVKMLLLKDADACFIRDENGRTPLHLAVMKGRVNVMKELILARPEVIRYTVDQGETLLHLAVKHNRPGALKLFVELERNDDDFVNIKDDDGSTILHVASALKRIEIIKYLLSRIGVKVNAVNGNGFTALDIIEHTPRDLTGMEIRESLLNAGALRAKHIPDSARDTYQVVREHEISQVIATSEAVAPPRDVSQTPAVLVRPPSRGGSIKKQLKMHDDWLEKKRDALMIAATVIAAMAYQAGLNPPGGVWGDNVTDSDGNIIYFAGTSMMDSNDPDKYFRFWKYNTICFVASLSIILLLFSGLPLKRRIVMWILMMAMWVTLTFMALTYLLSMKAISQQHDENSIFIVVVQVMISWLGLMGIVFLMHTLRFIIWVVRKVKKHRKNRLSSSACEDQEKNPGCV